MDIGKEIRRVHVEPVKVPQPEPVKAPAKEKEKA